MLAILNNQQKQKYHWGQQFTRKRSRKYATGYKNKVHSLGLFSSSQYQMYKTISKCITKASTTKNLLEKMFNQVTMLSAENVIQNQKTLFREFLNLFKSMIYHCFKSEKYYFSVIDTKTHKLSQKISNAQNKDHIDCYDEQTNRLMKQMMLLHTEMQEYSAKIIGEIVNKIQSSFLPNKQLAVWQHVLNKIFILWPHVTAKLRIVQQQKILQKCQKNISLNEKHENYAKESYLNHIVKDNLDLYNQIIKYKQSKQKDKKQNLLGLLQTQERLSQINFINKYFIQLTLNPSEDDFKQNQNKQDNQICFPLISSSSMQSQQCWACISHFYFKQQINQELGFKRSTGAYRSYTISSSNWKKIEANEDRNSMEEILCRALNYGNSYIYIGLNQIKESSSIHLDVNSTGNQNIIKRQLLNQKFQSMSSMHNIKYQVQGIKLGMLTKQHRESVHKLLKKYIDSYIFPKINLTDIQFFIEYVPVLDNPLKNIDAGCNIDNLKGLYVIRIDLLLKKSYPELFYIETKSLNSDNSTKSIYSFFGDYPSNQSMNMKVKMKIKYENVLFGTDITNQILTKFKYYNKKRQNSMVRRHYPILCEQLLQVVWHEQEKDQKIASNEKKQKISEYYEIEKMSPINKPKLQQNPNDYLLPQKIQQVTSQKIYGFQPGSQKEIDYHHSLVIVSPTGITKGFMELFRKELNDGKYAYKIYQNIYQKLPKESVRKVFYMTHQKKHDFINKLAKNSVDHQKRNLIVLGITSQFQLNSSKHFTQAISLLGLRFKQLFNCNYTVALADEVTADNKIQTIYYFQFQNDCQSIFAFVLLEYHNIRCDFVKASVLDGLKIYKY